MAKINEEKKIVKKNEERIDEKKNEKVEVVFIMDRSGSMGGLEAGRTGIAPERSISVK